MGPSSRPGHTHTLPRRGTQILAKAYEKSERLALEFWDPRRLASHVLATLSPVEQRAPAVNLILEMKITGGFLSHYTYQIEELLPEGDCELIRAIARTIPKTFWIPLREPRDYDKYSLQEVVEDLGHGVSRVEEEYIVPSVEEFTAPCCQWVYEEEDGEEAEAEAEETEEDTPFPEPLAGEDVALVNDDHKVELGELQDDDEAGRGGSNRGPEREGSDPGPGDGDRDDDSNGDGTGVLRSLWAQISLAVRAGSRRGSTSIFWHMGSNFLTDSHDEDQAEYYDERTAMISTPGRARAGVSSTRVGSESRVVHAWLLGCVGLYGL